jgi:uncharacterized protein (TIGR03089 family)
MNDPTPATLLDAALRTDAARALLTFYDDATGERTELSVATFANWVAKTANLCRDDLGLDVGARVALALPLHWQAAVWCQTCWASGFVAVLVEAGKPLPTCDVAVIALDGADPDAAAAAAAGAAGDVVGLGLGPLGLPVPGRPTPAAVSLDYDREVHGHGDRFVPPAGLSARTPALVAATAERTAGQLAELAAAAAARWQLAAGDRALLATPYDDERALLAGLLVPLLSGSAAVLCRHLDRLDDPAYARRVATEGVTAVTWPASAGRRSQTRHLD